MTKFLVSVKKEKKKAKEKGYLDEEEADPIAFPLYKLISQWFLEEDDIMSFAFTVLQWGCMARSINIDPLGFHNFSKGQEDSIEIICGATKADKTGENVMPKNIFGNPSDHRICIFFALGAYLCINRNKFSEGNDYLFRFGNTKEKMAAKNYCKALKQLVSTEARKEYVRQYCRPFSRPRHPEGLIGFGHQRHDVPSSFDFGVPSRRMVARRRPGCILAAGRPGRHISRQDVGRPRSRLPRLRPGHSLGILLASVGGSLFDDVHIINWTDYVFCFYS